MVLIGLHGCMLVLATSCILGSFYIYFAVKETKGISLDVKQNNENTTNNSKTVIKTI